MDSEGFMEHESTSLLMLKEQAPSPLRVFFKDARLVFKLDELGFEILQIAFPAALALTADPIASLVDTAFIGQIGSEAAMKHILDLSALEDSICQCLFTGKQKTLLSWLKMSHIASFSAVKRPPCFITWHKQMQ